MSEYPKRLYLNGEVIDAEASNSVVVQDAAQEASARESGYRSAYDIGGNGGSPSGSEQALSSAPDLPAPGLLPQAQDGAAPVSAGQSIRGIDVLRAAAEELGVRVDRRWGAQRIHEEIAKAADEVSTTAAAAVER